MYYLWHRRYVHAFRDLPTIILVEADNPFNSEEIIRNSFSAFKTESENEYGYVFRADENLEKLWKRTQSQNQNWKNICDEVGVDCNWISETYLRRHITFLPTKGMTASFFQSLTPGDLVQFGDVSFGVLNEDYRNRWCQIIAEPTSKPYVDYGAQYLKGIDGWIPGSFRVSALRPFYVRNGVLINEK